MTTKDLITVKLSRDHYDALVNLVDHTMRKMAKEYQGSIWPAVARELRAALDKESPPVTAG